MSKKKTNPLLETIFAEPQNDTNRLVYADWCDEQGDADRAEFIRVQIERASLPFWDARQIPLRVQECKLLRRNEVTWRKELPRIKGVVWGAFRRGFVATANFSSFDVFRKTANRCCSIIPLEAIKITWPSKPIDDIDPLPQLRELTINETVYSEDSVQALAMAPVLSTIEKLVFRDCDLGGVNGLLELGDSPHLGNVQSLRIPGDSIGNGGVEALTRCWSMIALKELEFSDVDHYNRYHEDPAIGTPALRELSEWSGISQIESLILSGNDIGQSGLASLLRKKEASNIKRLGLRRNDMTGRAMRELRDAVEGLQLEVLDVGQNLIGEGGIQDLAQAECLSELKVLHIDQCEIAESGARKLSKAPFIETLRHLNANNNYFFSAGLWSLLERQPKELHTLQIANNGLGIEGALDLADSKVSQNLMALDLSANSLEDEAIEAIAGSENLSNLVVLKMQHNANTGASEGVLARSPLGQQLVDLDPVEEGEDPIPF